MRKAQESVIQKQKLEFDEICKQLEVSGSYVNKLISLTPIQLNMQSKLTEELKAKWEMCEAQELVVQKQRLESDDIRKQLEVSGHMSMNSCPWLPSSLTCSPNWPRS